MSSAFIGIGHGGADPGAVAYGLKEKEINLVIGLACGEELERHGVKTFYSRKTDEYDPVFQEVKEADASGADINVAFHANAGKGDGSETFCNTDNPDGVRLAELMEEYAKKAGQNSRGVKDGMHLKFVRGTKKTSVLHECAFIDNDKDNDIIDTKAEQIAYGKMQARAILDYFGIEYKEEVKESDGTKEVAEFTFPTIRSGSEGKAVMIWQVIVGTEVDGEFGSKTKAATVELQKELFPDDPSEWDGIVGKKTWKGGFEKVSLGAK